MPEPDFSTPEAAIRTLEEAYRQRDLEAAVACKDFIAEAELMLRSLNQSFELAPEVVAQTAEVLELSFRAQIAQDGFLEFAGISSSFVAREEVSESLVLVTERFNYPDGSESQQQIFVNRGENGWRVLNPG